MKKIIACLLIVMFALQPIVAFAAPPREAAFNSYVFNRHGRAVPTPASYMPAFALSGIDMGVGALRNPSDITTCAEGYLYILDAGNGRIIILDENFEVAKVLDSFTLNGEPFYFGTPSGMFVVPDGRIHIADEGLGRVITIDREGTVIMYLGAPESEILSENFHFVPIAVLEDASGVLYILSRGSYQGALMVDLQRDYLFLGFFGANQVEMSVAQLGQMLWRRIFTREQRERMVQLIPVEFTNFDKCPNGFIYVCTAFSEHNVDQLRILNSAGGNILRTPEVGVSMNYGDPVIFTSRYVQVTTSFVDITYIGNGIFAALDNTRGRVFVYTTDSHMVAQFGQNGEQLGRFTNAVALASFDNKIIVLDSIRGEITAFALTEYGYLVQEALALHNQGRFEESVDHWRAVLARNINFELAYLGIGRGLSRSGYTEEALWYLRRANNRQVYSEVFELHRNQFTSDNFNALALGFIGLCIFLILISKRKFFMERFSKNTRTHERA
ncbi:MAG: hypothetical protein FWC16_07870 [Defluviitaleaceae bacterium]|nr:hypothetical protein [Defluviitaleaceae bacterium]MCL2274832.1 hypothetical protein [Defluviitaleaceae bacterium]